MVSKLKGILLASDLDGTLIGKNFNIPKRNIDSIKRLKKEGGYFCIASGRSMQSGLRYINETKPNAPCILINGAVLYDFENGKILWDSPLPHESLKYIERIKNQFPDIGIEIYADKQIYLINSEYYVKRHMKNENLNCPECNLKDMKQKRIYKALFAMSSKRMGDITKYTDSIDHECVKFVATSDNYYEMISSSVDKGTALLKLIEFLDIDISKTYAIGDYCNDIEMITNANIGAATDGAEEIVKNHADVIVGSCDDGAVADFIEYIEKS